MEKKDILCPDCASTYISEKQYTKFGKCMSCYRREYMSKNNNVEYINNNSIDKYITYVENVLEFENYLIVTHLNEITLKPILNKLNHPFLHLTALYY